MKTLFILFVSFVLLSCGGGSSQPMQSTPAPTPSISQSVKSTEASSSSSSKASKAFTLKKLNNRTPGTLVDVKLTGKDSNGFHYTGSYTATNKAKVVKDGVLVTPVESLLVINEMKSMAGVSAATTSYYDATNDNFIGFTGPSVSCVSSSPYHTPETVKIGDFDTEPSLVCDDGTTVEINWRTQDDGSGNLLFTLSQTTKKSNAIVSKTDISNAIAENGDFVSLHIVITNADEFTLTIDGKF